MSIRALQLFCKVALLASFTLGFATGANAAEIKVLCARALGSALELLIPDFQQSSGHKVAVSYANIGTITKRIREGEYVDLGTTSPAQWEALQKDGKITDFRAQIAKVGIGIAIKNGIARPDLSNVEAVKQTLLKARTIVINDPARGSPSAARALRLFERLGIAEQIKSKLTLTTRNGQIIEALKKGDAELGVAQANMIAQASGVELAGALPPELQFSTVFTASIPKTAKQAQAAKAFVKYLKSPKAAAVFKAKGLEPG